MTKARLEVTKDYGIFEMHEFNRPLHKDKLLEESMKAHGFMPSSPIHCVKNGNETLKVIRGHHRLDNAKRLGLPVYYIIDESNKDIFELEGGKPVWTVRDFAEARSNAGNESCEKLLWFSKKHNLPLGVTASLLGGESAGSNNKTKQIKKGNFELGDMTHANKVVRITDTCRDLKIPFASSAAFVSALSAALRVKDFDTNVFIHKVNLNPAIMRKRGTMQEYLEEIEAMYNYGSKQGRIPLAFKAREIARARKDSFGRNDVST